MQYFYLTKHTDNSKIYTGYFPSFSHCLEQAIKEKIDLSGADLSNKNISNANMDGAYMPNATFSGSNLTGTNLSESYLKKSTFNNTTLYNTCLSCANLEQCDFRHTNFGATLINGANIQGSIFSTLSCFDLDFQNTAYMKGCVFEDNDNCLHSMSSQPIVVKEITSTPIIILDTCVKIGFKAFPKTIIPSLMHILTLQTKSLFTNNIPPPQNKQEGIKTIS